MAKVKLLKLIRCDRGDMDYNCELLIPFVTDHIGWEEVSDEDYVHLVAWVNGQRDYALISESESFAIFDALKQQKDRLAKIREKESENRNKEAKRALAAEQKKKERELNKLKKLAEKFPNVIKLL